jgi:poly(3-hydroxybutyrate) depolymerase
LRQEGGMGGSVRLFLLAATLAAWLVQPEAGAAPARLETYGADLAQSSASGVSSGGYMAVQFDVAFSAISKGAGIVAAGPYDCAQGKARRATMVCSCAFFCLPGANTRVRDLIARTDAFATAGAIDATANLRSHRVWLFSGGRDGIVPPRVVADAASYYEHYAPGQVSLRKEPQAQHGMPTLSYGVPCSVADDPYLIRCGIDAAGDLLAWIYGTLQAKATGTLGGAIVEFDQAEFLADPTSHGMATTGWVFVPSDCTQHSGCRIHVALHGCRQYPDAQYFDQNGRRVTFGETFVRRAGYLEWADTNRIIVLFPQAAALPASNPQGCWDWWGYDDSNYAVKSGRQLNALRRMVGRLAGEPG